MANYNNSVITFRSKTQHTNCFTDLKLILKAVDHKLNSGYAEFFTCLLLCAVFEGLLSIT